MKRQLNPMASVDISDWKSLYQSKNVTRKGYTEIISNEIIKNFGKIKWKSEGLRTSKFKQAAHSGDCKMSTDVSQFTEKRFCRALYNHSPIPYLGNILDYEIPLTEPKQKIKVNQGEIDLLSVNDEVAYFIEAKKIESNESLLKAILEIFVYVYRLKEYDIIKNFMVEYNISQKKIIPAILCFENSVSGQMIKSLPLYTELSSLINLINSALNQAGIGSIEYYMINDFKKGNSLMYTNNQIKFASSKFNIQRWDNQARMISTAPVVV